MRAQIRLADRQGLLTGRHLSSLQVLSVYYRETEEQAIQQEINRQEFKYALLSTGRIPFPDLFPEMITVSDEDEEEEFESPGQGDTIIYKFAEQPDLSPAEMEAELAALMAGADDDMNVNGGELYG